jgi:glycosyltransferase involved in cell wall biosynthesis
LSATECEASESWDGAPGAGGATGMKVLFVSPFPPAKDGIGAYTRSLVTALRDAGADARVVLPRPQPDADPHVLGALTRRRSGLARLSEAVAAWGPDIIHVQFAVATYGTRISNLLAWLHHARSVMRIPVIVTMHEVTRDTASLRNPGRLLYRSLVTRCDHVIVHTNAARSILTQQLGVPAGKVSVIPHTAIPAPRAVSTQADLRSRYGLGDAELLISFGFVHVDKGLDDLIRCLRIVRGSDSTLLENVRVVIAGTVRPRRGLFRVFELRDWLHLCRVLQMARWARLRNLIVVTGYVPDADVAAWFEAAAGIVLPYKRTEQSGVAALANAACVPVLASTAGGLGEQYEGSEWLFPPRSPEEFAKVLTRFLCSAVSERAGASAGPARADLRTILEDTLSLYHSTISNRMVRATADRLTG